MARSYSWPVEHWNWPIELTHKHGVRSGSLVFTGGQVDLDADGNVRNPGNIERQCKASMDYLLRVLESLGADRHDLVKLVVYFVGHENDEKEILSLIGAMIGDQPRPVVNTICLPSLCYDDLLIEIEGVAIRAEDGTRVECECHHLPDMPQLPSQFSHVVRCGDIIFTGDMSAISPLGTVQGVGDVAVQTKIMMDALCGVLSSVGADIEDVLKLNVYYVGDGTAENWEVPAGLRASYFPSPGPAATGMPVNVFANQDVLSKISVTAMRGKDGSRLEKEYAWPEGHWDWTAPLPYKHGNKCGQIIHVGGQVSLDASANVIDPDDMVSQTRRAMDNIAKVLAEHGATLDDVVKVTTFYQGDASAEALHENLRIRSNSFSDPGPATTGIPMPALVYEHMMIEIEVIAIVD